jgi:hypothetical protein
MTFWVLRRICFGAIDWWMSVEAQEATARGPAKRHVRPPGPRSRGHSLLNDMDWCSPEGQLVLAARRDLTEHVGGHPNNVQRTLIERASRLQPGSC